jgi:hypothetical protein
MTKKRRRGGQNHEETGFYKSRSGNRIRIVDGTEVRARNFRAREAGREKAQYHPGDNR